jgi:peptidyl-prolyl cis-trans isomerase B (cyclophilin B)
MRRLFLIISVCLAVGFAANAQSTKVLLKTSLGDITLMLYDDTPMHKDNFIELVNKGFYNGIRFHRVIPNFMVQVGDARFMEPGMKEKLKGENLNYKIPAEIRPEKWHKRGALAAARQGDKYNPRRESSGTQFYIVTGKKWGEAQLASMESARGAKFTEEQKKHYMEVGGYASLDLQYTVFGEVTKGIEVAEKIGLVERNQNNMPLKDVKIISAKVIK